MPNIAKILKDEIQRLSRKEVKDAITGLRRDSATLKRTIAEHKRRIKELEKQNKKLLAITDKEHKEAVKVTDAEAQKARITPKVIKNIRKRLQVSQAEFALLIGVSLGSVAGWEQKKGRLKFRDAKTKAAIFEAGKLTKTEAQERPEKIPTKKEAPDHTPKKPASKKSAPTAREVILKIISRFKKGVTISKLKELTGFDDKKIRNVLYFAAKQRKVKGLSRGVYAMKLKNGEKTP